MIKIISAIAVLAFLGLPACKDMGLHTGQVIKDCASIPSSEKKNAAEAIKNQDKQTAIKTLAVKYSISEEAASDCLK